MCHHISNMWRELTCTQIGSVGESLFTGRNNPFLYLLQKGVPLDNVVEYIQTTKKYTLELAV